MEYILGEPVFGRLLKDFAERDHLLVPTGQVGIFQGLLLKELDEKELLGRLREEYFSIVDALIRAKVDFRIAYAHEDEFDQYIMESILQSDIHLFGFPQAFPSELSSYPRDMLTHFPGIIFLNFPSEKGMAREKKAIESESLLTEKEAESFPMIN